MLLIYDIVNDKISNCISVSPSIKSQPYLYSNRDFNCFTMCRISDVFEEGRKIQRAKYQLFTIFQEKLGMLSGTEYLITYTPEKTHIQTIGYKLAMLSKKVIQKYDWLFIKNSSVVPFYDGCGSVKGC